MSTAREQDIATLAWAAALDGAGDLLDLDDRFGGLSVETLNEVARVRERICSEHTPSKATIEQARNRLSGNDLAQGSQCALWFMRWGNPEVEICRDENEAVVIAMELEDDNDGIPSGIQYADGRCVRIEDVEAYQDQHREVDQRQEAAELEMETVTDPFSGRPAPVAEKVPAWLLELNQDV